MFVVAFCYKLRHPFDRTKDHDPFKVERNKLAAKIAKAYVPKAWTEVTKDPIYQMITEEFTCEKIDDLFRTKAGIFHKLMHQTLNNLVRSEIMRRASLPDRDFEKIELMRLLSLPPFNRLGPSALSEVKEFGANNFC